jgi:hypothetical protein
VYKHALRVLEKVVINFGKKLSNDLQGRKKTQTYEKGVKLL